MVRTVFILLEEFILTVPRRRIAVAIAAILSTVALALAGCGAHESHSRSGPSTAVDVVAAENFWGDITKQIGGDHVKVTSVISDPNADPHLYESDAKTAAAVNNADLVIVNGLGYDDFMDKLLSASPNQNRKVLTAADAIGISGPDANPHIWYDIAKVPEVGSAIATQLGALAPDHAATFTANAKRFSDSLAPINAAIANIKTKYLGAPVGYTERVPGYVIQAAGLKLVTPVTFARAIEDGNDPSPGDNAVMDTAVSTKAMKVLLYNEQTDSPAIEALKKLAQQSGVPIVGVTETQPPTDPTFQAWQLRQLNEITAALGQEAR
jgi:zinc/manganese transport system substrate-binding protein